MVHAHYKYINIRSTSSDNWWIIWLFCFKVHIKASARVTSSGVLPDGAWCWSLYRPHWGGGLVTSAGHSRHCWWRGPWSWLWGHTWGCLVCQVLSDNTSRNHHGWTGRLKASLHSLQTKTQVSAAHACFNLFIHWEKNMMSRNVVISWKIMHYLLNSCLTWLWNLRGGNNRFCLLGWHCFLLTCGPKQTGHIDFCIDQYCSSLNTVQGVLRSLCPLECSITQNGSPKVNIKLLCVCSVWVKL